MAKNVQSIIDDLQSGLAELRMHFESLGSIFGEGASPARKAGSRPRRKVVRRARRRPAGGPPAHARKARRKIRMSPALRKQRQLQGRYMALVKRLPKAKQARVKKVRERQGYAAALKMLA